MEKDLVARAGIPFAGIEAGGLHGVGAPQQVRNALKLTRGLGQARRVFNTFKPDAVLLTGGFVGVPVSLVAWLKRVPSIVFLPDVEPGLAVKAMSRLAWRVATTTEASARFLPAGKMQVTGYPVRPAFATATRAGGRAHFDLPDDEQVLLVFGGSRGARSINRAVLGALGALLPRARVIHVTGTADWEEVSMARERLSPAQRARYTAFPYLHEEMPLAMAAADLVVCRSGASSLGELPALGLPAVLVPYPHAWRYQRVNAQYLADRGAALILEDGILGAEQGGLRDTVLRVLDDTKALASMRSAMRATSSHDGARRIAELLREVVERD